MGRSESVPLALFGSPAHSSCKCTIMADTRLRADIHGKFDAAKNPEFLSCTGHCKCQGSVFCYEAMQGGGGACGSYLTHLEVNQNREIGPPKLQINIA